MSGKFIFRKNLKIWLPFKNQFQHRRKIGLEYLTDIEQRTLNTTQTQAQAQPQNAHTEHSKDTENRTHNTDTDTEHRTQNTKHKTQNTKHNTDTEHRTQNITQLHTRHNFTTGTDKSGGEAGGRRNCERLLGGPEELDGTTKVLNPCYCLKIPHSSVQCSVDCGTFYCRLRRHQVCGHT